MKLIVFAFILFLRGNSTEGNKSDVEQVQDTVQTLLNRIATLEERLDNSEKEKRSFDVRLDNSEKEISELKKNSGTKVLDILIVERVDKLEQLSKYKTLRTCQEISNRGLTLSGMYDIDPDGQGIGYEPITL